MNAGDILIVFNSSEPKYQIEQAESQIGILYKRIELLNMKEQRKEYL